MASKKQLFELTAQTDRFFIVYGVKFEARELSLQEYSDIAQIDEKREEADSYEEQIAAMKFRANKLYGMLTARYIEEQEVEMFTEEAFLNSVTIKQLQTIQDVILNGEVTEKDNLPKK